MNDVDRTPGRDRLRLLLEAAERLTVDLIAQPPVTADPRSEAPREACAKAVKEKFDVLPLRDGESGQITRFVRREELERRYDDAGWDAIEAIDIHPSEIVSATSPILDLLDRFGDDRTHVFVLDRSGIEGIVTVFDLNQPAAHQFGFALSLVVEGALAEAIEAALRQSPDELDADLDDRIYVQVRRLARDHKGTRDRGEAWRKKVEAGDQIRLMQELVFGDKLLLADKMRLAPALAARCRRPYGTDGRRLMKHLREEVKALRNAVAHDWSELADERSVCRWMRTTLHLAHDLQGTTHTNERHTARA